MKTFNQIKDILAKSKGYVDWFSLVKDNNNKNLPLIMDAAGKAAFIYAEQFKTRWINVNDKLPLIDKRVVVKFKRGIGYDVTIAWLDRDLKWTCNKKVWTDQKEVICWAEIPD